MTAAAHQASQYNAAVARRNLLRDPQTMPLRLGPLRRHSRRMIWLFAGCAIVAAVMGVWSWNAARALRPFLGRWQMVGPTAPAYRNPEIVFQPDGKVIDFFNVTGIHTVRTDAPLLWWVDDGDLVVSSERIPSPLNHANEWLQYWRSRLTGHRQGRRLEIVEMKADSMRLRMKDFPGGGSEYIRLAPQ
jgi:hypothetical protein